MERYHVVIIYSVMNVSLSGRKLLILVPYVKPFFMRLKSVLYAICFINYSSLMGINGKKIINIVLYKSRIRNKIIIYSFRNLCIIVTINTYVKI